MLLVGVDGFDWGPALELLREDRMPNLAALMARGVWGELRSILPTLSPRLWTTIATGKRPKDHGILHFMKKASEGQPRNHYTSYDRRTQAFWNVLSDAGYACDTIGWWMKPSR